MRGDREVADPAGAMRSQRSADVSSVNVVLALPPLTALVYLAARPGIRYMTLLFGLVIALHGTAETAERINAYTAFTHAMTFVAHNHADRHEREAPAHDGHRRGELWCGPDG
ncbi:MAG: hypothetical protein ACRDRI_18750 [Pseudonocardiaceae bacterium]